MNIPDDDDFETLSDTADSDRRVAPGGRSLKSRAIGFLSRREYSRVELQRKLAPHAGSEHELSSLLDDLERGNWLSTERYAQSLVNRKAARQGAALIMQELRQHGVSAQSIAEIGAQLRDTEYDRARAVWEKKFGTLPVDPKDYARQFRFLASRGFSTDCVRRILGGTSHE